MSAKKMKIAIDCDDAGGNLKKAIYTYIKNKGYDIVDIDCLSTNPTALYPEIGYNLAHKVHNGEYDRGILICGTGLGMAMIANKVEGVWAGVCHDTFSAERLVKSNNAQIITMGERVIGIELAKKVVDAWLDSEFQGGGSITKVAQLRSLEQKSFQHKLQQQSTLK